MLPPLAKEKNDCLFTEGVLDGNMERSVGEAKEKGGINNLSISPALSPEGGTYLTDAGTATRHQPKRIRQGLSPASLALWPLGSSPLQL